MLSAQRAAVCVGAAALALLLAGCPARPLAGSEIKAEVAVPDPAAAAARPTAPSQVTPPAGTTEAPPGATGAPAVPTPDAGTAKPLPPAPRIVSGQGSGTPVAIAGTGLNLAYRFTAGAKATYDMAIDERIAMKADLPEGTGLPPGAFGGNMTSTISGKLTMEQEIRGVNPKNEAQVAARVTGGEIHFGAGGMTSTLQMRDGKVTVLQNGKPSENPRAEEMFKGLAGATGALTVAPTGKVLRDPSVESAGAGILEGHFFMPGGGGYGFVIFPKRPVKPGDSWTETQSLPMRGPGERSLHLTLSSRYTLTAVREREGRKLALVNCVTTLSLPKELKPPGAESTSFKYELKGKAEFDIDAGQLASADYTLSADIGARFAMPQMRPPQGGAGPGGGPTPPAGKASVSTKTTGTIQVIRKS